MVQAGMGLTRVVVLIGAGMAGSVVLRNGRLSEILGELQVRRVSTALGGRIPRSSSSPESVILVLGEVAARHRIGF